MRFLHKEDAARELTYEDVFLLPQYSEVESRMDIDITPPDGTGATIPITVSNMTSAAGKRMAETVTRRGGLVVLTQDTPLEKIKETVGYIKTRHPVFETPVVLDENESIQTALNLIHKRAHGAIVIVDKNNKPVGIFTESDARGKDKFNRLGSVMETDIVSSNQLVSPKAAFEKLHRSHISALPIIKDNGELMGIMTKKGAVRSDIYKPALNKKGEFVTAVAVSTKRESLERIEKLLEMGVDIIAIDTAHGHSKRMLNFLKAAKALIGDRAIIHAAQVATASGVEALVNAGADIVNVGIGAGGSCTTRIMTATGRPQLSAVIDCAAKASQLGAHIWADSRIREPRDLALAMAAGASNTMIGTLFAGTYESPGDIQYDESNHPYKISIGMASAHAVRDKFTDLDAFELAKKQYFVEGTHEGRIYLREKFSGVEDIIDYLISGLRSAMSYTGAKSLKEFHEKAILGIQTQAAYNEGEAIKKY